MQRSSASTLKLMRPRCVNSAGRAARSSAQFPRAYVVPADLAAAQRDPSAFEKELQAYIAKNAAPHKRLRGGVRVIAAVNKSPSGKILRRTYSPSQSVLRSAR